MTTVEAPSSANMYPYNGVVIYINGPGCTDASAYSGVSFTLSGDIGTCTLVFSFGYSEDLASSADSARGTCSGTCYPSQFSITTSSTSVSFSATPTSAGMPVSAVDKGKLTGVQFQLAPASGATSSCTANISIGNIKFM
jgi:hypothetical protein